MADQTPLENFREMRAMAEAKMKAADTEFEDWLATRPTCVQRLAREFPLGTCVHSPEGLLWLLGYTEGDMLIVSPVNPADDYDGANADKRYICADHLRNNLN